jgi:hypothetical protein
VCFLTEFPKDEKSSDDIEKISEFLDKSISELDSKLGESPDPNKPISDSSYHFIYFNPDSMSMCTSFLSSILPRVSTASLPPPNIYSYVF